MFRLQPRHHWHQLRMKKLMIHSLITGVSHQNARLLYFADLVDQVIGGRVPFLAI